mgnify:CR=1 FL=1
MEATTQVTGVVDARDIRGLPLPLTSPDWSPFLPGIALWALALYLPLSGPLGRLEEALGAPVFERGVRGVQATPDGAALLPRALAGPFSRVLGPLEILIGLALLAGCGKQEPASTTAPAPASPTAVVPAPAATPPAPPVIPVIRLEESPVTPAPKP